MQTIHDCLTICFTLRLLVTLVFIIGFAESVNHDPLAASLCTIHMATLVALRFEVLLPAQNLTLAQAWILLEMPGFDADLEHSIFAGDG